MGWVSPRRQKELAREAGENLAAYREADLGRRLTASELRAAHREAEHDTAALARLWRREGGSQ